MDSLFIFSLGCAIGALAIYLPWISLAYRKYVLPCRNGNCPHHGAAIRRQIQANNDAERQKPPRPPGMR